MLPSAMRGLGDVDNFHVRVSRPRTETDRSRCARVSRPRTESDRSRCARVSRPRTESDRRSPRVPIVPWARFPVCRATLYTRAITATGTGAASRTLSKYADVSSVEPSSMFEVPPQRLD
jgi:hypothetical protein